MRLGCICGAPLSKRSVSQLLTCLCDTETSRMFRGSLHTPLRTAIMVACLASFPSLFKKSERNNHQRLQERSPAVRSDTTSRKAFFFSRRSKESKESTSNIIMNKMGPHRVPTEDPRSKGCSTPWNGHQKPSFDSSEHILPYDEAHIGV